MRKRKKVTKYRGSKTHGGGSMKKRRGAGHRGGRGRAGSGKKGDGKKPRYWREAEEKGFSSHLRAEKTVNAGHLNSMVASLVQAGKATEKAGVFTVDLQSLNIEKLLGSGTVDHKLNVTVAVASARAVEKIEAAGGSVTTTQAAEE